QALLLGPQTAGVPDAYIPPSLLPVLTNKALAQCVGKDGGVAGDAFLNDPRGCHFDPKTVQCKAGQDPSTCLSPAQVAAARAIYRGAHANGELLFPGYEPGGESNASDWPTWLVGDLARRAELLRPGLLVRSSGRQRELRLPARQFEHAVQSRGQDDRADR